ncbi:C3a anaphylatoxin chemotactic receptor-like [Scleropages formosus]|nr:C3a anaphylatoxin chemotactic receptor-like isoform X2 [Scleropages formosus]KPP68852.1 C3a anaphylatoxin chemotactic receptor-like [Scleropages formosus]
MMSNSSFMLLVSKSQGDSSTFMDSIIDKIQIVLYTLTIVFGTTGNGVVIWVAGLRMPPTVTNVWLINLAVADFIFCLTRIFSLVKNLFFAYWPFGTFLCKFNGLFKYANMFCSVFLLSIISMDRALCVWRPVWTKQRRTVAAARLVSFLVWVLAVALSSPYFVFRRTYLGKNNLTKCTMEPEKKGKEETGKQVLYMLRFLCGFLLPFLVILCCYVLAAVGIRRTRLARTTKPLKILAGLVSAFFLCWAPYHFFLLAKMVNGKSQVVKLGGTVAKGLAYFNSCVNPLLYFCMGVDRRKSFKQSLSAVCKRAMAEDGEGPTAISAEGERRSSSQHRCGTAQDQSVGDVTII